MLKTLNLLGFPIAFLLFCASYHLNAANPEPVEKYPYSDVLINDGYYLYWKHTDLEITFEIHYKNTSKWILFGISSNSFSDVITGWVNDD